MANTTVLLCVYAGDDQKKFYKALKSITVEQTLKPRQVIIVQDGPLDYDVGCIIDKIEGSDIKLLKNNTNIGLACSLNRAIEQVKTEFITRIDSDDVALPIRIEEQTKFFLANPDVDVLGSATFEVSERFNLRCLKKVVLRHEQIIDKMKTSNPLIHTTVMLRSKIFRDGHRYPELDRCQDYMLWYNLYKHGYKFSNLEQPLMVSEIDGALTSKRKIKYFIFENRILKKMKNDNFISSQQYLKSFIVKLCFRLLPVKVKVLTYRVMRNAKKLSTT